MNKPIFSDSELFCLEDAMNSYKITHSRYCDSDALSEINDIITKLEFWRIDNHKQFKAIHNLTCEDKI